MPASEIRAKTGKWAPLLRQLPNLITVLRVLLVLPTAWYLWLQHYLVALILVAIAGLSDALDGWLARRLQAFTRVGATLDPLADKLLIGVLFVTLTVQQHLPLWLVVLALGRDALILFGAGLYRWLVGPIQVAPTMLSKVNTALQISLLIGILIALAEIPYLSALVYWIIYPWLILLVAALVLASGIDYTWTWTRKLFADRQTPG